MSCCHTTHETTGGLQYVAFNRASCPLSITHRLIFQEDGVSYLTIEHYLAFKKAAHAEKPELCQKVLATRDPALARTLVRCIRPSATWDEVAMMKQGLRLKFAQHSSARIHLCSTRDAALVSTYPVGSVWGVRKMKEQDVDVTDASKRQGENRLGELLAELRHLYRVEKEQKQREPVLQRSGSFYDLTIDEELGRFCQQLELKTVAADDDEQEDSDVEMPSDFVGYDPHIFEHGPACLFCDVSASFVF